MNDGWWSCLYTHHKKKKKTKIYMKELVNSVILADVFLFVPPTWLDF